MDPRDRRYPPPPAREERAERHRYDRDRDYDPYARYDRDERYDRYRPSRDDRYRSPPPRSPPRRSYDRYSGQDGGGYTFRGAAAQDDRRPPPDQFSFRAPGPRFPSPDRYAPPPPVAPRGPQQPRRGDRSRRGDQRRGGYGMQRGGRQRPPPSSREILYKTGRASTPEQLEGMNADGQVRFNALASSSEESDDDDKGPHSSSEEEGEIRRKRFKVDTGPPAPKPDMPKWSNPDPYSALPPVEAIGAPKKDIVQVIRKAKNDVAPSHSMTQAAENADFISFTFDDNFNDDKASTGQADTLNDASSDASSVMGHFTPMNVDNARDADTAPSFRLPQSYGGEHKLPPRPPPVDLDSGPPSPPPGFVMPSDEELVRQYVGQPQGKKRKHDEQSKGKGDITDAWAANWTNSTPWCLKSHSQTADIGFRLSEEIADFFDFVRPHHHEEVIRRDLIERVQTAVRSMGGDAKNVDIKCFGSFAAGLYLPTADMDLVAISQSFMRYGQRSFCQSPSKMHKLVKHLMNMGVAQPGTTTAITRAKVPIIKFTDKKTGIKVDISFENDTGLVANETFQEWKERHPSMPAIVVLIKQMLAMRDLNEVYTGGLGGFSIICLVVSMLELAPECRPDAMGNEKHHGDLLLHFLDLYGNKFNLRTTGIVMDPPGYYDKIRNPVKSQNAENLTIIDPNNPTNDISGGSREVHAVFEVFRKAHSQILQRMARIQAGRDVSGSILGCVLGGNYSSFIHQRDRLVKLSNGENVGPLPPAGNVQPRPQKRPPRRKQDAQTDGSGGHQRWDGGNPRPPPGGPLAARIQGGPPTKKGGPSGVPRPKQEEKAKVGENTVRATRLKQKYPALSSEIPKKLSKRGLKSFKETHNIS